jgi:hypothetical protein
MKAFVIAIIILTLLVFGCIANDVYCHSVCKDITYAVQNEGGVGAKKALDTFRKNEFLLKCSVDNGYVSEARVSLESLAVAYGLQDRYEIQRYTADSIIRVNRIKTSLFI